MHLVACSEAAAALAGPFVGPLAHSLRQRLLEKAWRQKRLGSSSWGETSELQRAMQLQRAVAVAHLGAQCSNAHSHLPGDNNNLQGLGQLALTGQPPAPGPGRARAATHQHHPPAPARAPAAPSAASHSVTFAPCATNPATAATPLLAPADGGQQQQKPQGCPSALGSPPPHGAGSNLPYNMPLHTALNRLTQQGQAHPRRLTAEDVSSAGEC